MATQPARKEVKPKLKIVIRGLPPQLTEQAFLSTVDKQFNEVDFFYYAPGRITEKKSYNSRAYINFNSPESLQKFASFFDGHVFVTNKGKEQKARVEFAPFQKVPNKHKKRGPDPRENTIESDTDFLKFVEASKQPIHSLPSAEEQLDKRLAAEKELESNGGFKTTPLLEYLKQRRAQKINRSERRRKAKERTGKEITVTAIATKKTTGTTAPTSGAVDDKKRGERPKKKEERRKKKRDTPVQEKKTESITLLQQKDKPKEAIAKPDEGKPKNGNWQKKNNESGIPEGNEIMLEAEGSFQPNRMGRGGKPSSGSGNSNSRKNGNSNSRRGGGRGEPRMKVYAPKAQPTAVPAANGP